MRRMRIFVSRLRGLISRRPVEEDLQQEIASHLDEAAEEYARHGLSAEEARRAALRSFGGVTQTVEAHREARGWTWLESLLRDVRRAIRLLRRSPAVTAAAVLSLALGMGGTTTMFSLLNGLILRPLPVQDPERLAVIRAGDETNSWKISVWEQLEARPDLFDGLFAWDARSLDLAERGESQPVRSLLVSGRMFDVLGLNPQVGRLLRPTDDVEGGGRNGPVAVISDGFWRRHYGGAPDVVGRTLGLNGATVVIVGVTPASFFGPEIGWSFDVAVPIAIAPLLEPDEPPEMVLRNLWLSIMTRLKPDQDAAGATSRLRAVMPDVLQAADARVPPYMRPPRSPEWLATVRVELARGGPSSLRDQYDRSVVTVTAIALIVLLIACVNLAHLFLARGEARRRELAIATALGASRARLVRQLVIEGLVLSMAGATAGLAIAMWAVPVLVHELSPLGSVIVDLPVDWRLLGFTGVTAVLTALIFSAAPALRVTRFGRDGVLTSLAPAVHGLKNRRLSGLLTVLQVGLSLVLTVSAILLTGTFVRLQHRGFGFDPDAVLMLTVSLKGETSLGDRAVRYRRILDAVNAMPEVASAADANVSPLTRGQMTMRLMASAGDALPVEREVFAKDVTPGWFQAMGIRLRAGRDHSWEDAQRRDTMVINQSLARQFFGEQNPVGSTVSSPNGRPYTVIGVVDDAVYRSAREGAPPTAYLFSAFGYGILSVRAATGDPARLRAPVIDTITRTDPDVRVSAVPLSDYARATVATERLTAILAAFFGVLALGLSAIGVYGVMAYSVSRRRTELAIRRALGATGADITGRVVGRSLRIVAGGVVLGTVASLWMTGLFAPLLYGVESRDTTTFVAAAVLLTAVALSATWLPARRAARLNPAILLRDS